MTVSKALWEEFWNYVAKEEAMEYAAEQRNALQAACYAYGNRNSRTWPVEGWHYIISTEDITITTGEAHVHFRSR